MLPPDTDELYLDDLGPSQKCQPRNLDDEREWSNGLPETISDGSKTLLPGDDT